MNTLTPPSSPRVVAWLTSGDTGCSSETLCAILQGMNVESRGIPIDSQDFGRCVRMLDKLPELREIFNKEIAALNSTTQNIDSKNFFDNEAPAWKSLAKNWATLETLYRDGIAQKDTTAFKQALRETIKDQEENTDEIDDIRPLMQTAIHHPQCILDETGFHSDMPVKYFTEALKMAEKAGFTKMEDLRDCAIIVVEDVGNKAELPATGGVVKFANKSKGNLIFALQRGGAVNFSLGYHDVSAKVDQWGKVDGFSLSHPKGLGAKPAKKISP